MGTGDRKQAVALGSRIAILFLLVVCFLVFVAYFALFQSFQDMLIDYTIQLVRSMVEQGVTTVEYELRLSQGEAQALAGYVSVPAAGQEVVFPDEFTPSNLLRMTYVTKTGSLASDGRQRDPRGRPDIVQALGGSPGIYGPYFNQEHEYVICYSAPVFQNGAVAGVLSLEKDGYSFCSLIQNIQFAGSGEAYIINAEGTDIAVSRQEHIDWVNSQYNARKLLEAGEDPVTRSILELEQRGLDGQTGVGVYEWEGSPCYVAYAPIPSVNWVLLAGLRQEELAAMTQSTLSATLARGPVLALCITVFLLLTAVVVYWIIASLRRGAELNERLKRAAGYDALTGIMNRYSYHTALDALSGEALTSLACVYIDANGLHELNNHLGHQAGDRMLKAVADGLEQQFPGCVYRIGGDEFVVLCRNLDRSAVLHRTDLVRRSLQAQGYDISIGTEWRDSGIEATAMVNLAEDAMQQDKRQYYRESGRERQRRLLDQKLEQMVTEKKDADTFLSVLAPGFRGVYFVDMGSDTIRHLFIPPYFEEILKETGDHFSQALLLYAHRIVAPPYRRQFISFCQYPSVEAQLSQDSTPEFVYQKIDGAWIRLQILKFKAYTEQSRETLWIFAVIGSPEIAGDAADPATSGDCLPV